MTDRTLGQAVLAYDELLRSPHFAAVAGEMRARLQAAGQTSALDQAESAARTVHDRMRQVMDADDLKMRALPPAEHPDWVRLGLTSALMTWVAGKADTCRHSPSPDRPQPIAAAAWKPGLVVCGGCIHLLSLPAGSVKDRTCDGCGRVTTGMENNGDGIWQLTVTHGELVYLAGACSDCRYWESRT